MAKPRKFQLNPDQLPMFKPAVEWTPPEVWPDFMRSEYIAIDTETFDPKLEELGPGFIRRDAHVCGISLVDEHDQKIYLPIGHAEDNLPRDKVIGYLKTQLKDDQEKVFANAHYDLEALWSLGITNIGGVYNDIQVAEPLLDEEKPEGYSLDVLSRQYLGEGKTEDLLNDAARTYGHKDAKKVMHKLPGRYVAPYAIGDADKTLQVYLQQVEALNADDVWDIYKFERKLIPTLFKMRLRGVRVDLDKAQARAAKIKAQEENLLGQLFSEAKHSFNHNSTDSIAKVLRERGFTKALPQTKKNNDSITNEWLIKQDDFCQKIVELRVAEKMRRDFLEGAILEQSVKHGEGHFRIHCQWHSLRDMDLNVGRKFGTRSGRLSSSDPNMQQIPARDSDYVETIRGCFVADDKDQIFIKSDYASQEPRVALCFAAKMNLPGAAEAVARYMKDKATDYHNMVRELILEKTGKSITRFAAKTINLGVLYGMGRYKLANSLGVSEDEAGKLLQAYFEGVPFVQALSKKAMARADENTFVRTILGRKRRFIAWEPSDFSSRYGKTPMRDKEAATRLWGSVSRAGIHKALNAIVQGSSADQTKHALIELDENNLLPLLTVHDEICGSYLRDKDTIEKIGDIMEHTMDAYLKEVPFMAEISWGEAWANPKEKSFGFVENDKNIIDPRIGKRSYLK